MALTALQYANQTEKVDQNTQYGIAHAVALAGKEWGALPPEERTGDKAAEKAKEIAARSVQNEDLFLENAGTRALVARYTDNLIERSYAKDGTGKKGESLIAYLDEVAAAVEPAVKDGSFDRVRNGVKTFGQGLQSGDLAKFQDVKAKIAKASRDHIGTVGPIEDDFLRTLKDDAKKAENDRFFKDVSVNESKASKFPNLWELILGILAAAFSGDMPGIKELLGQLTAKREEQQVAPVSAAPTAAPTPAAAAQPATPEQVASVVNTGVQALTAVTNPLAFALSQLSASGKKTEPAKPTVSVADFTNFQVPPEYVIPKSAADLSTGFVSTKSEAGTVADFVQAAPKDKTQAVGNLDTSLVSNISFGVGNANKGRAGV